MSLINNNDNPNKNIRNIELKSGLNSMPPASAQPPPTSLKLASKQIYDIEWYMLEPKKYYPYTVLSSVCVRTLLYPLTLVRTRLQLQVQNTIYKGTWDALRTIVKLEGFFALYKSFLVYNCQILPNVAYISSFERLRHYINNNYTTNNYVRSMVAGGLASLISQTMVVPIDVVTQHMMLIGQKKSMNAQKINGNLYKLDRIHVPTEMRKSNYLILKSIIKQIYASNNGISGFYRGYLLSTALMSLNSALWWPFYYFYQEKFKLFIPNYDHLPLILIQCACAPLSTISSNILTNPLDVIRARMQITKTKQSLGVIVKTLWEQEKFNLAFKGLTARLTHSCFYSFFIILGYETVKKNSLKEEYQ